MEIKKIGRAGTVESNDISIVIEPSDKKDIEVELQSAVLKQFGRHIKALIIDTLQSKGVKSAYVKAVDKGAIDCVIKARTLTALYRAAESEEYVWEE
ncbi:MAG TPA: citrate lyase acyl carrier protein [Clostridiales bacterium]|uniref:citrate lyase acyl carrier protein n=1 Tax=Tepidanaerobacter sp. GT38 TaxID=2722793 RepID=UPI0017558285|nr:citrate lyase acyl carrier protein [Tepidanaerobacter sp. GT38]MCG1012466.1 citrate lyase acyl carrier protein [Tepidanaerobacter sp. GT38]HHU17139.1 citrate lyase acyl carrier protein [Clostridiales bacterium]